MDDDKKLRKQLETEYYVYDYINTYRTYFGWGKEYKYDFCILTEKESKKKVIRLQKRFWGISKKMIADGRTRPKWIVYDTYNLNSSKDFPSFFKIIEKFKLGKLKEVKDVLSSIDFTAEVNQISSIKKNLKKLSRGRMTKANRERLKQSQIKILQLSDEIIKLNDENRSLKIQNYRSHIEQYRKVIKGIKRDLVAQAGKESHFQKSFTNNKWIFGPWYEEVIPKRKADPDSIPDFVLKRFDGFADIVEIEAPKKKLFTNPNKSGKSQPRAELIQALSQIIEYIDSYNDKVKEQFYKDAEKGIMNPLNPYRPKGLLIIGRDVKSERKKLRQLNSFLNNVSILTYDEFLMNSESMIEFLAK